MHSPQPTIAPLTAIDQGVAHGRFQIVHNDHIRYISAVQKRCRHLVIGITRPDPLHFQPDPWAPHRSSPVANPLSYWERYQLVMAALKDIGLVSSTFSIVPFPIHYPERYVHYLPLSGIFFMTPQDPGLTEKSHLLESIGLRTETLKEPHKNVKRLTSGEVRQRILDGKKWHHMVPPSSVILLTQWKIVDRLNRAARHRPSPN